MIEAGDRGRPANGDTCETNNALDLSRPSGLCPNAASRVLRSAYAEWTVNLFCIAESSDPFTCSTCGGRAR
jgi:hypothetical protein